MVKKTAIDIEELALLIEDSLSACAGSSVKCPTIHLRPDPLARENWFIELDDVDILMSQAIQPLQQRFNVKHPAGFTGVLHSSSVRFAEASRSNAGRVRDGMPTAVSHPVHGTEKPALGDTKKLFDECVRTASQARGAVQRWTEVNRSFRDAHKVTMQQMGKLRRLLQELPPTKWLDAGLPAPRTNAPGRCGFHALDATEIRQPAAGAESLPIACRTPLR